MTIFADTLPFRPLSLPPFFFQNDASHRRALIDKPEYYVSHLLGHEGEGSLLSYLKREGLANALGAGTEGRREGGAKVEGRRQGIRKGEGGREEGEEIGEEREGEPKTRTNRLYEWNQ